MGKLACETSQQRQGLGCLIGAFVFCLVNCRIRVLSVAMVISSKAEQAGKIFNSDRLWESKDRVSNDGATDQISHSIQNSRTLSAVIIIFLIECCHTYELLHEKTCLQGFRPGPTQTRLYRHRRWLEA